MKAYGKSWGYNVYDCRYCLYRKGKIQGCVYPDGCCCPVPQKPARRNGVDVVCTTKSSVRISGDDKPAEVVRSQFLKLNSEHIRVVMGGLKENTTRIRNMRQYLLATLYNAPLTIGNYYRSLVSHDMSEGFI